MVNNDVKSPEEAKLNKSSPETSQTDSGKLSVFQKFCYGVGGISYQITVNCIGLYLPIFLLEMAQVK